MSKFSSSYSIPQDMLDTIDNYTAGLGATGIVGGLIGPGADLVVIVPSWVVMTVDLAEKAGKQMSKQKAKKIALAVCTGAGALMGGTKVASVGLAWLTAPLTFGWSLAVSAAANAALNATFTRSYGRAAARYFLQAEEIESIDVIVSVLIAFIGADMGFDIPDNNLIS